MGNQESVDRVDVDRVDLDQLARHVEALAEKVGRYPEVFWSSPAGREAFGGTQLALPVSHGESRFPYTTYLWEFLARRSLRKLRPGTEKVLVVVYKEAGDIEGMLPNSSSVRMELGANRLSEPGAELHIPFTVEGGSLGTGEEQQKARRVLRERLGESRAQRKAARARVRNAQERLRELGERVPETKRRRRPWDALTRRHQAAS